MIDDAFKDDEKEEEEGEDAKEKLTIDVNQKLNIGITNVPLKDVESYLLDIGVENLKIEYPDDKADEVIIFNKNDVELNKFFNAIELQISIYWKVEDGKVVFYDEYGFIDEEIANYETISLNEFSEQYSFCYGLKCVEKNFFIESNNFENSIGNNMDGGDIILKGNVIGSVGNGMKSGSIKVYGNVQGNVGERLKKGSYLSIMGDIEGNVGYLLDGGNILIKGNVQKTSSLVSVGQSMKQGALSINGNVIGYVGQRMNGGAIVIKGEVSGLDGKTAFIGKDFIDGIIDVETIGKNVVSEYPISQQSPEEKSFISKILEFFGFK